MAETTEQTFLFADLAGFTALTEAHGDEEAAELAAQFSACLRDLLPDHAAEELKTIGDAMMIRGDDPAGAIELGLRIVEEIAARPEFPIVRVGMHTGPAVEREADWFGAAVNLAARVSGIAAGNEVLLTDATVQAAGGMHGVELRRRGEQRFKNVGESIMIYQASREGDEGEELPIDPVCRMAVDPARAAAQLTFEGREYHFCSIGCVNAFSNDPARYVADAD